MRIALTQDTNKANFKVKPDNEYQQTKNCIYKETFQCGRAYIGETKRFLNVRIKEHKKLAQLGDTDKSKLVQHALNENHRFLWGKVSIISKEEKLKRGKLKEAA